MIRFITYYRPKTTKILIKRKGIKKTLSTYFITKKRSIFAAHFEKVNKSLIIKVVYLK